MVSSLTTVVRDAVTSRRSKRSRAPITARSSPACRRLSQAMSQSRANGDRSIMTHQVEHPESGRRGGLHVVGDRPVRETIRVMRKPAGPVATATTSNSPGEACLERSRRAKRMEVPQEVFTRRPARATRADSKRGDSVDARVGRTQTVTTSTDGAARSRWSVVTSVSRRRTASSTYTASTSRS